jgi:predicted transposase YbfD/YdcC
MALGFLVHLRVVPAHCIAGRVTYPFDEVLLATPAGVVRRADDWEGSRRSPPGGDWLRGFLPFADGIPTAQTLRQVFRLLDAQALQRGFAAWAALLCDSVREMIAADGKTLRGSKTAADGTGALHLVSAYATAAGRWRRNEIMAIPKLLDMLLEAAIVMIGAMGRQKEIARQIVDMARFFADPACTTACARAPTPKPAMAGLQSAHAAPPRRVGSPNATLTGKGLRSLAAVTAQRIDKKTGQETLERPPLPSRRSNAKFQNHPHHRARPLASTTICPFDEDRCRTRKDASALNFAIIRDIGHKILKADRTLARSDENTSEPASTQRSTPAFSPLYDLGFSPV